MRGKPTLYIVGAILIILFAAAMVLSNKVLSNKNDGKMESPVVSMVKRVVRLETPTPVPSPTPKAALRTFTFGSSTDLKQELDTVDPKVLGEDFN